MNESLRPSEIHVGDAMHMGISGSDVSVEHIVTRRGRPS